MVSESFTPGDLLLSGPVVTSEVTIKSGADVAKGTVLGRITTGGKLQISLSGASDGSEDPVAIALHDIEASGADATAAVAFAGVFNGNKLVYGTGHTAATVEAAFRLANANLFVKSPK